MTIAPSNHLKQLRHERIAVILKAEIRRNYSPGDRLPSISALARQFGVSDITLRNALLSMQQEGLIEVQHGRGTFVSEGSADTRSIAVYCDWDLSDPHMSPVFLQLIQRVTNRLQERGLPARSYIGQTPASGATVGLSCPAFISDLKEQRIKAVVLLATPMHDQWKPMVEADAIPVLGMGFRGVSNWHEPHRVDLNYQGMVETAVAHVAQHGHRRVACLGFTNQQDGDDTATSSVESLCRRACEAAGLDLRDDWIRFDVTYGQSGAAEASLRKAWDAHDDKPDALLVMDDNLCAEATSFISSLDINVPDDLMVVVETNNRIPMYFPFPVTRIEFDVDQIADTFVDTIMQLMDEPDVIVEPPLIDSRLIPAAKGVAYTVA